MATKKFNDPDKKRFLLYGPPKCWKTTSLATVPKGTKIYFVDADRQTGNLKKMWKKKGHRAADLEIITIPTWLDADETKNADKLFMALRSALWSPPQGFDFYVCDGWTTVGIILTHDIIGVGDRKYDQQNNTILSSYMNDFFWQFAGAAERYGAWSVHIMHEQWKEVVDQNKPKSTSWKDKMEMLSPVCATSAKTTIPAQCDFVFHVEPDRAVVNGKSVPASCWRTRGTQNVMAASVGFDDELSAQEDADFAALFKKLNFNHKAQKRRF